MISFDGHWWRVLHYLLWPFTWQKKCLQPNMQLHHLDTSMFRNEWKHWKPTHQAFTLESFFFHSLPVSLFGLCWSVTDIESCFVWTWLYSLHCKKDWLCMNFLNSKSDVWIACKHLSTFCRTTWVCEGCVSVSLICWLQAAYEHTSRPTTIHHMQPTALYHMQ